MVIGETFTEAYKPIQLGRVTGERENIDKTDKTNNSS